MVLFIAPLLGLFYFQLQLDKNGMVYFKLNVNNTDRHLYPEDVGSIIISTLRSAAASNLSSPVTRAVLSVPAEFDQQQRNYTRKAAQLAGNLELFLVLLVC